MSRRRGKEEEEPYEEVGVDINRNRWPYERKTDSELHPQMFLAPWAVEQYLGYITAGGLAKDAAVLLGVEPRTIHGYLVRGAALIREHGLQPEGLGEYEEAVIDFSRRYHQVTAWLKSHALINLRNMAIEKGDWRGMAKFLELRYPAEFGPLARLKAAELDKMSDAQLEAIVEQNKGYLEIPS